MARPSVAVRRSLWFGMPKQEINGFLITDPVRDLLLKILAYLQDGSFKVGEGPERMGQITHKSRG